MLSNQQKSDIAALLISHNLSIPIRKKRTSFPPHNADLPLILVSKLNKIDGEYELFTNEPLIKVIDEYCIKNKCNLTYFYQKADLSRQCMNRFCNLKTPKRPNRNTLISILFALELPAENITYWMNYYGFVFPQNTKRDRILCLAHEYMLTQPLYLVRDINEYLFNNLLNYFPRTLLNMNKL